MPFWDSLKREGLLEAGWEKNATYQWGIPLHPLGELNTIEYVMSAQGDIPEMRVRARGVFTQLSVNIIANYVFFRNLIISAKMLYRRPHILATWCCLIQALAGVTYTIFALTLTMPGGPSCRVTLWIVGVGLAISPICVSIVLLQKAYIVHARNRHLLIIGSILILPQPFVTYFAWASPATMVPSISCLSYYPSYAPWVKFATDAPINAASSVAFLIVVYRQYRQYGSGAWARLVRNGIQTMCLIVLSNLLCMLCAALEVLGLFSEMFIIMDWILTSLLLVHHCGNLRATASLSNKPRVYYKAPNHCPDKKDEPARDLASSLVLVDEKYSAISQQRHLFANAYAAITEQIDDPHT
ncbi:hypothetical protein THASP1DRAFT_24823 [Thamnocephalis sphaerospora]|uniref:Uncharacterized protein n=1 Tax=Thamnocephalis sphaerospora TaxID=78915 RepID=A0A4P9XNW9_9FUNG|nr:hypothetical protein THASP1DRAFT_24823 [Thamnocephalis sphaerospora]|eukprot:RKP06940.1 hypothetical protein THASP1DRAFT_24823 [Thamnocephalis sphaerospora]